MLDAISYILLGAAFAATIGPVCIETVRRGLKCGFMPAFLLNMGATFVDAAYLLLIFFGLSSFIANPTFRIALGLFGAAVLAFFGISSIREFFLKKTPFKRPVADESRGAFVSGMLLNLSNPMAVMAWLAFYGIVSSSQGTDKAALLLNISFVILGVAIWGVILSFMAHLGKKFMTERALRYVSLMAGMMLVGFGLYFGYAAILG